MTKREEASLAYCKAVALRARRAPCGRGHALLRDKRLLVTAATGRSEELLFNMTASLCLRLGFDIMTAEVGAEDTVRGKVLNRAFVLSLIKFWVSVRANRFS